VEERGKRGAGGVKGRGGGRRVEVVGPGGGGQGWGGKFWEGWERCSE